jgi:N-acetylmuramoyl-L-alanine amidase
LGKIKGLIDFGHAKSTPGKRAGKNPVFYEYESNRKIAVKLKKLLEATGHFEIVFPYDINATWDMELEDRAAVAIKAGCKFLVSIHSNADYEGSPARGTETLINMQTQASLPFAQTIHKDLVKALGTKDRGVKRQNLGILNASYKHMLCCLTEGEFFTNPEARKWMLTEDYSNKYAQGVANGLCSYYKVAAPKPQPQKPKEEAPFMLEKAIVVNTFGDAFAAEPLSKRIQAPIYFRDTAEKIQVAKKIYVCGGSKEGLKGNDFVELTGADRWLAANSIGNYVRGGGK